MENKKTLVIGASENPTRYSNMAIRALRSNNFEVIALAKRKGMVEDVAITTDFPDEVVHTVTLFIGPNRQPEYYFDIIKLKPKRVIFNPGTENPKFCETLQKSGIEAIEACTLVLLRTNQF